MAARRGRKVTTVLVVLFLLLVGVFVASDRVAAYAAEQTVAKQARKELVARGISAPKDPTVAVGGFPFLTQVLRGRYDRITISVRQATSQGITLDRLDLVATGVNAKASTLMNGNGPVTADLVTGTATMGWAAVLHLVDLAGFSSAGASITALPDGRVQIKGPVAAFGVSTTVVATGSVGIAGGKAKVTVTDITTEGGNIPEPIAQLLQDYKQELSREIALPPLPYHLVLKSASTSAQGLLVTATATDVPLAGAPG